MFKGLIKQFNQALFPENYTCELCGIEIFDGGRLCKKCAETVQLNDGLTCPICGRRTQIDGVCLECKSHSPSFKRAVSAMVYRDGAVNLVLRYKSGNGYLKNYFAEILTPKCREFTDAQAVCYIPMTEKAKAKRGYNQAELLAREIAKNLDLPVLDGALTKVKETPEQKKLTKAEREKNLKGCFKADRKIVEGKTLILVDDVLTTGATAEEAVTQLKKRRASKVYFATIASVEYNREI
ncbi:MAG: ComF family protein [Candidatus Coproplasma sp.]